MPTNAEFLSPVLALVAWTLVMWIWMYATRIPAMNAAGIDPQEAAYPGTWAHRLKSGVRSVADNYNHLHEQPTIFYALMFFAAMTGGGDATALKLALGLRDHPRAALAGAGDHQQGHRQVLDLRAGLDRADDLHVP